MPGPKTYGSVASNPRRRLDGCVQREVGTTKPLGSSGVEARSVPTTDARRSTETLLIRVISLAELGAAAIAPFGGRWIECRRRLRLSRPRDRDDLEATPIADVLAQDPRARWVKVAAEVDRDPSGNRAGSVHDVAPGYGQ